MDPSRQQLIASIAAIVETKPDDPVLRLHLAELLVDDGQSAAAIPHIAAALQQDPASAPAQALMGRALGGPEPEAPPAAPPAQQQGPQQPAPQGMVPQPPAPPGGQPGADGAAVPQPPAPDVFAPEPASGPGFGFGGDGASGGGVGTLVRDEGPRGGGPQDPFHTGAAEPLSAGDFPPERAAITLADVAGMEKVKERVNAAFLMPMRNEELRAAFAKNLRGGLLLYGPPGCGKTFLARAVAGELGASFLSVSVADIVEGRLGSAERNLQALFRQARQYRPSVVFIDELDAIGGRRGNAAVSLRPLITQLLTELDSVEDDNDGVFFLAATNHPWDIDSALKRPGRLDRMLFVPPPDRAARAALVAGAMQDRPDGGVDPAAVSKHTEGFSGADLTHLVDSAAERAMLASARAGQLRSITMDDFRTVLGEVRPSTGPWMETARNVVQFSNDDSYDELSAFLRAQRRPWGGGR
ncbi:ATP-binding protein [Nocardiopsis coralliicola]